MIFFIFLLLTAAVGLRIDFVGILYGGDFLVALGLMAALLDPECRRRLVENRRIVIAMAGAVLVAVAFDLINRVPPTDVARGLARNGIFVAAVCVSWCAMWKFGAKRWDALTLAMLAANGVWALVNDPGYAATLALFVKFGVGIGCLAWIPSYLLARWGKWPAGLATLASAGAFWFADARGYAAIAAGVGACLLVFPVKRTGALMRIVAVLVLSILVMVVTLEALQRQGFMRSEVIERGELSNALRTDMAWEAFRGFLGSPVVGRGTWQFARTYIDITQTTREEVGVHSIVLQLCFEYGLLGFLVSACGVWFLARTAARLAFDAGLAAVVPHYTMLWWIVIYLGYNICFSPFAGDSRYFYGFMIGGLVVYMREGVSAEPRGALEARRLRPAGQRGHPR